jgi:type II secretion system protein N
MAFAVKNKKWLGYALYVVLVTLLLLYYLFPSQTVEEFIDNRVARIDPAIGFKAEKIGLWVPAGLRINTGQIYLHDSPSPPVFKADSVYLGPRILPLVKGKYSFDLSGRAYHGDISGWLDSTGEEGKAIAGEVSFKNIDLADYGFLTSNFPHNLAGKISGDIEFSSGSAGPVGGNGKGDLRLTDGQLRFQTPLFGIAAVDLQNIDLQVELRSGVVQVIKAQLAGPEVNGSMSGSITLQPNIKNSTLNLKGTLEPLAEFYKNYPEIRELLKSMRKRVKRGQYFFVITGTLKNPIVKLL